jgi:hypothetical protein
LFFGPSGARSSVLRAVPRLFRADDARISPPSRAFETIVRGLGGPFGSSAESVFRSPSAALLRDNP